MAAVETAAVADATTGECRRLDAVHGIESELGEIVSRVRAYMRRSAEVASPGLTPASFKALGVIARREPVTLSALAEIFEADKSLISRAVRELEEHGFITRTRDPMDGRSQLINTTDHARARLEAAREQNESRLVGALAEWDVVDIERLAHLLHALNASDVPDAR